MLAPLAQLKDYQLVQNIFEKVYDSIRSLSEDLFVFLRLYIQNILSKGEQVTEGRVINPGFNIYKLDGDTSFNLIVTDIEKAALPILLESVADKEFLEKLTQQPSYLGTSAGFIRLVQAFANNQLFYAFMLRKPYYLAKYHKTFLAFAVKLFGTCLAEILATYASPDWKEDKSKLDLATGIAAFLIYRYTFRLKFDYAILKATDIATELAASSEFDSRVAMNIAIKRFVKNYPPLDLIKMFKDNGLLLNIPDTRTFIALMAKKCGAQVISSFILAVPTRHEILSELVLNYRVLRLIQEMQDNHRIAKVLQQIEKIGSVEQKYLALIADSLKRLKQELKLT